MYQAMWKDCNRFVKPLLQNDLEVNDYNMLNTNIMADVKLGTKDTRKGNIHLMKEAE